MECRVNKGKIRDYYRLGFSLIPLAEKKKNPAIPWKCFQDKRADETQLIKWLDNNNANYNFGIVTGMVSGIVVVDADSDEALTWCQENLPYTPMRTKTAKGEHLYFKHTGVIVPNGVKLKGMALDVRGDGGQIVAPSSIHPTGIIYEELGDWSSLDNLPKFDPEWITGQEDIDDGCIDKIKQFIVDAPCSIQGENGSAELMRVVGKLLHSFKLKRQQALPYLSEWNQLHARPPWSEDELQHALDSAEKKSNKKKHHNTEKSGIFTMMVSP